MSDLRVSLGRLTLPNPILVAAGTFGYGLEFARAVPLDQLGGLITKTLTLAPREGHPPPRLVETPAGMLNAVGLQNIGLEAFLKEKLPALRRVRTPLIVSILGERPEEVAAMAKRLDAADGVAAMELNLSCPNLRRTSSGRARFVSIAAHDAEATRAFVQAARGQTRKTLLAKLSPDVTDLTPIAQAAEQAGADALTLGNTFVGMRIDPATRRSSLGAATGGLSGPAIRPLALYRLWYTVQTIRIPVIGLGGIARAEDAVEFFIAGASAVAVGTATFADPRAALRILHGLSRYLARHGFASVRALSGSWQE